MRGFTSDIEFREFFDGLPSADMTVLDTCTTFVRDVLAVPSSHAYDIAKMFVELKQAGNAAYVIELRDKMLGEWTSRDTWSGGSGYMQGSVTIVLRRDFTCERRDRSSGRAHSSGPLYSMSFGTGSEGNLRGFFVPYPQTSPDSCGVQTFYDTGGHGNAVGFKVRDGQVTGLKYNLI